MKKKTSRKRHLFLTKNFIMMLVMLVVIIVAVSAWFTVHKEVIGDNIYFKATRNELSIAKVVKTETSPGVYTEGPGEFLSEISFSSDFVFVRDCTGDGETLIVPDFNVTNDFEAARKNDGKEVNINQAGSNAISNEMVDEENPEPHYYEYQFYIRSSSPDVYLDPDSFLISRTEKNGVQLNVQEDDVSEYRYAKKSDYGNNSDGLVGAMRVSLLAEACYQASQTWAENQETHENEVVSASSSENEVERQLLWNPRPDVHLNIPNQVGDITHWYLSKNDPVVQNTYYYQRTYDSQNTFLSLEKVDANQDDSKMVVSTEIKSYNSVTIPFLTRSPQISTFTKNNSYTDNSATDGTVLLSPDKTHINDSERTPYYLTKYTIRLWIEGTDNEARRAMDGGQFDLIMKFR